MGRVRGRGWLIGAALVAAIAVVSVSALVFETRDETPTASSDPRGSTATTRKNTTTSSSTSTTTTTTTVAPPSTSAAPAPPPPPPAPAPAPIAPPAPAPTPFCDGSGSAVIDAMNGDRAANGVGPLCGSGQLASYAQGWANWMAEHQTLTHQDLHNVLAGTSFNTIAENILDGPAALSVGQMESAWMASAPHRENILNGTYTAAGVGIAYSSDGRVWAVVDFGG